MSPSVKLQLLAAITAISLFLIFLLSPIAQDPFFHHFADTRTFWGISNFGNVSSNLPFLVIGMYGLVTVLQSPTPSSIRWTYAILFAGVILTGLGSGYYHNHPDNDTLVWDRIPMTIVFMSFSSATVAELISRPLGAQLLWPLLAVGIGSVLWWHYTETFGKGDLRLYMWVQFYPMLAIGLLLALYFSPAVKVILPSLVWIVIWYVVAKVLEQLDFPIYRATGISGHSLKHLAAAVSTLYFVRLFRVQYLDARRSSLLGYKG